MTPDDRGATPAARTWAVRLVGLLALALGLTWPQALHPGRLYGSWGGEVDNHFWMLWVGVQRLTGHAGPFGNAPTGWEIPLMDPVNLPWWAAFAWMKPEYGYTAVLWANLVLAGLGGGELAVALRRRVAPDRAGVAFWGGALAAMASPPLLGFMDFGITEGWTVGWYGLHAAWLIRWGEPGGRDRHLYASAVAAAAVWGSGWYNVVFLAATEPLLWLAAGRWSWKLPALAALAAVPRLPALAYTHAHFGLWAARMPGISEPVPNHDWVGRPFNGADVAAMFRPSPERMVVSHAMYLGWATLALAGLALLRRPAAGRARRAAAWVLGAAVVVGVLAVGHRVRFMGVPVLRDRLAPAGFLTQHLTPLRGITHWDRAEIEVGMLLAGLAGVGLAGLGRWGRSVAVVLVLVDALVYGGAQFPRQAYATDPPPELAALTGTGAWLMVPVDNTVDPPRGRSRRPYNQWQVYTGRPMSENYEGPDDVRLAPAVRWLNATCGVRPAPRQAPATPQDLARLADLGTDGFDWIVVVPELAPRGEACVAAVTAALGPPAVQGARIAAWPLHPTGTSAFDRTAPSAAEPPER